MPRKSKTTKSKSRKARPRRSRSMKGDGPAWDWIKKAAKDVHSFIKDKKLVSKGLSTLASSGLTPYGAQLNKASSVASNLGYGKRRRRRTTRK